MRNNKVKAIVSIGGGLLSILIVLAIISYIKGSSDITIQNPQAADGLNTNEKDSLATNQQQAVPVPKKEFTEFGDFYIEINKEGYTLKAPILGGVQKDDLSRGVGHHPTTALPNADTGNVVLSGHRWLPGSNPANTVFRHLNKLSVGDTVSIFHEQKEFVYRVRESKTVSNDAAEILDNTESPQLTLYTCTPLFTALKRLVYIADLIEVK